MTMMRAACCLIASLMATALGGCFFTPAETAGMVEEIKGFTLPADVMTGTGLIYVIHYAPSSMFSPEMEVFLDGEDDAAKVGSLSRGTYIFFYVLPGYHRISIPQWSRYEKVVEVEEGDILFIFLERNRRLIQIDGVTGRYYLMRLEPGD